MNKEESKPKQKKQPKKKVVKVKESVRQSMMVELEEGFGLKLSTEFRNFVERLNLEEEVNVKLTKKTKRPDMFISILALMIRNVQPSLLTISVATKERLDSTQVNEKIKGVAADYTKLKSVKLVEKCETSTSSSCIKEFFVVLVRPSNPNLKNLKLDLKNQEAMLDILERLDESKLETLSFSFSDNFGRFRGAFGALNIQELRELEITQNTPRSALEIADILKTIERCKMLRRLVLDFPCLTRGDEVVKSIGELENLEELNVKMELMLTKEQWIQVYKTNIFLCNIVFKGSSDIMGLDVDIRKTLLQFKYREYNYLRLQAFIQLLEENVGVLRTDAVLDTLDYIKLAII